MRKDISQYLQSGLKRESVYIEDSINRINAYFRYLAWFEGKVKLFLEKVDFEGMKNLGTPDSHLPDDWLYVGKLILLDNKQELYQKNRFNQRIYLSGVPIFGKEGYDNEIEKEAFERYESDIPILIVKESNTVFDPALKQKVTTDNPVKFWGSVLKGELYYNHILRDMPFEVKPKGERLDRAENFYFSKDAIRVKMKTCDKKFPLKRYNDNDEIYVYALEHNLTLKNIRVTERPPQEETVSESPVYIAYNDEKILEGLEDALSESNYKLSVSDYDPINKKIVFRAGRLSLNSSLEESYITLDSVTEEQAAKEISIELPFSFEIVPIQTIRENLTLFFDEKNSLARMIEFIEREIEYHKHMSESEKNDYDFFEKWLSIIEHQISKEEIDYRELKYARFELQDRQFLIVDLDQIPENMKKFLEIYELINSSQNQKWQYKSPDMKIAFEVRFSRGEKFSIYPLGMLHDIDVENRKIKVKLDSYLPEDIEFEPNRRLLIGFYRYSSALYRQKRALINFQKRRDGKS